MVFNRKRKDNTSSSFILDDGPKRSRVQAQRKFAQGSNVNSPVLTPVSDVEMQEKVMPEPIELVPMKRPNTEDFLTFLCFRGTPALPPSLSFFNNATMTDGPPPISDSPTSSKNCVILPTNISKAQGEKPFIAFGVRKRADPIVVSRHMDKKRRHALALQALRRKYQEQKMAKIRAITISKLSEKVQTNKTVVRTTRSVSKEEPLSKKHVGQKTKITVVATKHVKVTTRRTSTQIKPSAKTATIKQKMGLRTLRNRVVQRDVAPADTTQKKSANEHTEESDDDESAKKSDDDDYTSESSESEDGNEQTAMKPATPASTMVTRSNIIATRRNKRLLIQQSLKSSPTSPRLRSQLRIKMLQSKTDVKSTMAKRRVLTRQLQVSTTAIVNKIQNKAMKRDVQKEQSDNEKKAKKADLPSTRDALRKRCDSSPEMRKSPKKAPDDKSKKKKELCKTTECKQKKDADKKKKVSQENNESINANEDSIKKTLQTNPKRTANRSKDDSKPDDNRLNEEKQSKAKLEQSTNISKDICVKEMPTKSKPTKDVIVIKCELENQSTINENDVHNITKLIPIEDVTKKMLPVIENNRIRIDEHVIIEEMETFKPQVGSPKSSAKKVIEKKVTPKTTTVLVKMDKDSKPIEKIIELASPSDSKISQRPSRKTKEAAAIYMEILGRKLVHDEADDVSNDSFPELPNVRKMQQRENELKANMSKTRQKKVKDDNVEIEKKPPFNKVARSKCETPERKRSQQISTHESASDTTFSADIRTPPPKVGRKTRNTSPKFYKSFSDSESLSEPETKPSKKRKSENATDSDTTKKVGTKKPKKPKQEESFSESDEEPLAKLTQKASEMSKSETESNVAVKQKRECAKRPQNYLPIFSSSDEEEKFFQGFQTTVQTAKKKTAKAEIVSEALSTKDIGRRFGKGKVNMSNEQIEKWLNDSVIANMSLIKAENDEMLKFGERIPTETSLDNNLSAVNMEQLKNSLLKVDEKISTKPDVIPSSLNTTPEKSTTSSQKPLSNDKKTIFRKAEKMCKNSNAFSVCNESSVYAFEADNEDSVSTPFRRPSRRPSSTATSRSEDESARLENENKCKFRPPGNVTNKSKQEVSLMLADESNLSGSITVQVNLESSGDNEHPIQTDTEHMFYIPIQPGQKTGGHIQGVAIKMGTEGSNHSKLIMSAKLVRQSSAGSIPEKSTPMFPPSSPIPFKRVETKSKASCSMSETSDEFKYKVPSSPSASSSSSAKLANKKKVNEDYYKPINAVEFPNHLVKAQIVDAPIFRPTEKEFVDPLEYIEKIRETAEKFGVCKIVPPGNFKPECKVLDEMRFTAYNQYVHKMMRRWGPNFRELVAIRKYLSTQSISLKRLPWIGGIEIDLPKLYQTVQSLGGLKEVIEKKKWPRVAELMKIPKSAQDRVTKLDDIYCKYLLPYDTLTLDERKSLFHSVEMYWAERESKMLEKARNGVIVENEEEENDEESDSEDESDIECIVKGRSMALSAFYRIARNTMAMWFKDGDPSPVEVEEEFWKHVVEKEHHICVHSGSIDSGNLGYGFAVSKNSPFARHAWNLKVLTNNSGSILRSMGPVMGLTVPTLHVGMLYAGCCWYRDPHSLPWIEYLHTGANKIWYGIPDSMSDKFHETMLNLVPHYCFNKSLWLPTDTVMVPPSMLVENGLSLTRMVQEPGQFVVVFPKAFTSNICAGYVVSESVFWAPPEWLSCADKVFLELRNSCEPSMFSYERLLLSMADDPRSDVKVLRKIIPPIQRMIEREMKEREKVKGLGIKKTERLPLLDAKRRKKMQDTDTEYICEECRWNLYCTMICDNPDNGYYCLEHAIEKINDKQLEVENCKLMYTYDDNELNGFVSKINNTIEAKLIKKTGSKFSGMATLLNR